MSQRTIRTAIHADRIHGNARIVEGKHGRASSASATASKRTARVGAGKAKPNARGEKKRAVAGLFKLSEKALNAARMIGEYDAAYRVIGHRVASLFQGRENEVEGLVARALEIAISVAIEGLNKREFAEFQAICAIQEISEEKLGATLGVKVLLNVFETLLERANSRSQLRKAFENPEGRSMANAVKRANELMFSDDGEQIALEAIASELEIKATRARAKKAR